MEITWLGHSCFHLRSGRGTLLTDPYDGSLGLALGHPSADIVTVSNSHPHHSGVDRVAGDAKVISGPGEYGIQDFYIRGIGTATGEEPKAPNTAFLVEVEGLTLCHLGDLAQPLTRRAREELRGTDILFVPAGGGCTVSPRQAVEVINALDPKIVVPMHFHLEGLRVELDSLETLLRELGAPDEEHRPTLSVTRPNLPQERRVVALLASTSQGG